MKSPFFSPFQFVDNLAFNNAFGTVSGSIQGVGLNSMLPGLVHPEVMTFGATGLTLGATLPSPFAILFGTGDHIAAHGTTTNADTQSYSITFSGLVPASGASVTAFLVASAGQIQQTPIQIVGPPPGHPDYNPAFQPYTSYQQNVDTLVLTATTTPPDGSTTFELGRMSLVSGASSLPGINTAFWQRATANTAQRVANFGAAGTYTIPIAGFSTTYIAAVSGIIFTMPPCSGSNGLTYSFLSNNFGAGNTTLSVNGGSDVILGTVALPTSPLTQLVLPAGVVISLVCINGAQWWVSAGNQYGVTASGAAFIANAVSGFVKFTNTTNAPVLNGQGNTNVNLTVAPSGNVPVVTVSSGAPSGNPGIVGALWIN